MTKTRGLRFQLSDRIGNSEVSPAAVPPALLKQFADEVSRFLAGSRREVDPMTMPVSIGNGSLILQAGALPESLTLWGDLAILEREDSLHVVDPLRSKVVAEWQQQARSKPHRRYAIDAAKGGRLLVVDGQSNYRPGDDQPWVRSERYLAGVVLDMGGATSPNIHLKLDNGKTLKIDASQAQLADEKENHLYHNVLLRVQVDEHARSGELRNARLLGFEPYRPRFDSAEFDEFVRKGTEAWRDVADPIAWVREQRGS